jgi:hypothetical protein
MQRFYEHLVRGESKAQALRAAKLSFLQSGSRLSLPKYWGAFVLNGDGQRPIRPVLSLAWALVPGLADRLFPVLERHPKLKLVIPHMACPLDMKGREAFAGLDNVLALGRYPNVTVMVSSAPCFSQAVYPFADLHSPLKRIYETFGPRRMLWGADLSRLTSTYRECLDHFRYGLDFLSEEDKDWILGRALAQTFNWPESG